MGRKPAQKSRFDKWVILIGSRLLIRKIDNYSDPSNLDPFSGENHETQVLLQKGNRFRWKQNFTVKRESVFTGEHNMTKRQKIKQVRYQVNLWRNTSKLCYITKKAWHEKRNAWQNKHSKRGSKKSPVRSSGTSTFSSRASNIERSPVQWARDQAGHLLPIESVRGGHVGGVNNKKYICMTIKPFPKENSFIVLLLQHGRRAHTLYH